MKRHAFPQFGMSTVKSADLRQEGIVVIPFMDSVKREPERLQPHYHEFFQVFLLQGRVKVMHDFTDFRASGTTLVFMTPGQIHTARPEPEVRGTTVSFTQEFFDHHAPAPSLLFDFPFFFSTEVRPWLKVSAKDSPSMVSAFDELQAEFQAAKPGAAEILRSMLHIILVRANRLYAHGHPPKAVSRAMQLVRQFHLAVEQHFRELHSVADYARVLGVTVNHLHDIVREQIGRPAGEIIRERRLLDAKRLLLHSDMSVSEIGYHLGFEDPSYFARFFRRYADFTPISFREQIREKYQLKAG